MHSIDTISVSLRAFSSELFVEQPAQSKWWCTIMPSFYASGTSVSHMFLGRRDTLKLFIRCPRATSRVVYVVSGLHHRLAGFRLDYESLEVINFGCQLVDLCASFSTDGKKLWMN